MNEECFFLPPTTAVLGSGRTGHVSFPSPDVLDGVNPSWSIIGLFQKRGREADFSPPRSNTSPQAHMSTFEHI